MLQNFNPATACAVIAGVGGVCILAYLKVPGEEVAGYAAAFIGIAAALAPLYQKK